MVATDLDYEIPDIIEMDEIYTRVKKEQQITGIWTVYSKKRGKIVAFAIGRESWKVMELYEKTKAVIGGILHIYTDGNGCYGEEFKRYGISDIHSKEPDASDRKHE